LLYLQNLSMCAEILNDSKEFNGISRYTNINQRYFKVFQWHF
jgi:hypothetical protein